MWKIRGFDSIVYASKQRGERLFLSGKVLTTIRRRFRGARCSKTVFSFDDLLGGRNWANLARISGQLINQFPL